MIRTLRHPLAALTALALVAVPAVSSLPAAVADPNSASMMLVLDASGSMASDDGTGTPKIDAARKSLTSLVDSLPTDAKVGMRVLGATVNTDPMPAEACDDTQRVVDIASGNRAQLISAIGKYSPNGWTPIPKALEQAGADLGGSGKRSIVLVSDGESTCGDPCPTAESLASSGVDLTIDVVGLSVDETTRQQLQCVADKGKGKYYDAGNTDDLTKALQQAAQDRDVRPFDYDGAEVTGTANAGSAPTVGSGYWKDTIPATGNESDTLTRYYVVKRSAKQTDIAATALIPSTSHEQGIESGKNIVKAELLVGNDTCSSSSWDSTSGSSSYDPYFAAGAMSIRDDYQTDCRDADQMILKVDLSNLDLTTNRALQLKVGEWPRVADADAQGAAAGNADEGDFQDTTSKFGGATTQIQDGSSLASGPRLETNKLYQSTIVPGEMQTFTVPAGWGQSIASSINVMPVTNDQAGKLNRKTDSLPRIATSLIGADGEPHSVTSCAVDRTGCDTETSMVTDPIVYTPGNSGLTDQAGDYTVTVAMSDDEALAGSEFGYQLYVQTVGDILPPPNYQTYEESLTATPSPSGSRTTATAGPTTKGPSSATPVKHTLLAAGLGSVGVLLVVGGGLGIWFTTRRRR